MTTTTLLAPVGTFGPWRSVYNYLGGGRGRFRLRIEQSTIDGVQGPVVEMRWPEQPGQSSTKSTGSMTEFEVCNCVTTIEARAKSAGPALTNQVTVDCYLV